MLSWILSIFFYAVLMVGLFACVGAAAKAYFFVQSREDETHFFFTEDGVRLALHRYRPTKPALNAPVLICHGLGSNARVFDLRGAPSLPLYLRRRGFDVWVLDLRGCGASAKAGFFTSDTPLDWGFEDHLFRDVPAALRYVSAAEGGRRAHLIGHSMGGMLGVAHVASAHEPSPLSLTCIGSPVDFSRVYGPRYRTLLRFKGCLKIIPLSPLAGFLRLLAPLLPRIAQRVAGLLFLPNVDPIAAKRVMAVASEPFGGATLWLDFARFIETGVFGPARGGRYTDGLENTSVPILFVGGSRDVLAPRPSLTPPGPGPGSSRSFRVVEFGRASGCVEDYGHVDLVMGLRTEQEVFPLIAERLLIHEAEVPGGAPEA